MNEQEKNPSVKDDEQEKKQESAKLAQEPAHTADRAAGAIGSEPARMDAIRAEATHDPASTAASRKESSAAEASTEKRPGTAEMGAAPLPPQAVVKTPPAFRMEPMEQTPPQIHEPAQTRGSAAVPGNGVEAPAGELLSDAEAERRIRRMSRRSFLWGAAAVAGVWGGLEWLGTRRPDSGIAWPFRRVLETNENISRDLFSAARLAPEFPKNMAQTPRVNGDYGVASDAEPDWKLRLIGLADMSAAVDPMAGNAADSDSAPADQEADKKGAGDKKSPSANAKGDNTDSSSDSSDESTDSTDSAEAGDDETAASDSPLQMEPAVELTLAQIQAMPRTEMVTEFKCIEGWSYIVHWAGVRLRDFMEKYPPATKSGKPFDANKSEDLPEYVSIETPDGAYYVGLDMTSALHPQTLLCYEMNGKPLEPEHGAPLRLVIPVKYNVKNIKHIGTIKFTDERPRDYWANEGYDWYVGH